MKSSKSMKAGLLSQSAVLLSLLLPVSACAQTASHTTSSPTYDWLNTGKGKILERDHRDFIALLSGQYDNQEQVYFQGNLELPESDHFPRHNYIISTESLETVSVPASGMKIAQGNISLTSDDKVAKTYKITLKADGTHLAVSPDCHVVFTRNNAQFEGQGTSGCADLDITLSDQALSVSKNSMGLHAGFFRRANQFTCWVSPRKTDGSYAFYNDKIIHDQGGRIWITGDDHDRIGLKIRSVTWPSGVNRPSRVLYAYRGDDEDKAVSYAWTGFDSTRIGLNLRWVQASCTMGDISVTPGINLKTGSGQ